MNFKNNEYSETTKAIVNENKKLSSHKQVVLIII